jgi:hypothetical protein
MVWMEADGGGEPDRGTDGGGDPDEGRWRRQWCERRRVEAMTQTEEATWMEARTATEAATRMEAWTKEATAMEVVTRMEVVTWTEMPRWKVGAETRGQLTGPGLGATDAQAHRRLLQLAASYPHRLLWLASSHGDESRENEIEFCVREEREREIRREERFVFLSRESRDRNLWLW